LNFTQLIRGFARRIPHREAVVTDNRSESFSEFWRNITAAGQFYLDSGVNTEDRVLLVLPNSHEFLHLHFGALKNGIISVPVRHDYTGWEVRRMALNCEPRLVVATSEWLEKNQTQLNLPAGIPLISVEEAISRSRPGSDEARPVKNRAIASIHYSYFGGGLPKGAMLTHANHIYAATGYARHQRFRSTDRLLVMLPMCHVYALSGCVNAGLVRGGTLVPTTHFMPGSILRDVERHRVTILSSVPSVFECLANYKKKNRFDLSSLRLLVTGGAYLPAALQHEFEAALKTEMVQGYGLTECLPVICNPSGAGNRRGTLGIPGRRDIFIRIMGQNRRPLPPNEMGEIQIRSTTNMAGYYRRPEDTREMFQGEWLRTGDLGTLDSDGYLHFRGMSKPIVNLNGNKVDPLEVRAAILEHPAVSNVEVWAEAHKHQKGENGDVRLHARIIPQQNTSVIESEIRAFCLSRLAGYKVPQAIIVEQSS
jgi:long-chain acyl-CoA synthetase